MYKCHSYFQILSPSSGLRVDFFFFNAPATTKIYTLSLHDALPISRNVFEFFPLLQEVISAVVANGFDVPAVADADRKSTRLNSSHLGISYAVFCLKKKIISGTVC